MQARGRDRREKLSGDESGGHEKRHRDEFGQREQHADHDDLKRVKEAAERRLVEHTCRDRSCPPGGKDASGAEP